MRAVLGLIAILLLGQAAAAAAGQEANAALGQGLQELRQARFESAAQAFAEALRLDPSLALANYDLGICYFAEGRFDDAENAFSQTLRLEPQNRYAEYYLARISLIQNQLSLAISRFEALARNAPVADEFYYLGSAYWRDGNLPAAIESLKRAAKLEPSDSRVHYLLARVYKRAGKSAEAEHELHRDAKLRTEALVDAQQINQCSFGLKSLPRDAAINECRRLFDGSDSLRLVLLGTLLAQNGALEAAVDPLLRATHLDPEDYDSNFNLGLVYFHLKRYEEAKRALNAAVLLQPESFDALALLGSTLFALGEDLAAIEQLRHAHRLQPGNEKVNALLVSECQILAQHTLSQGDYQNAIVYVDAASAMSPNSAQLRELAFQVAVQAFAHSDYESTLRAIKLSGEAMQNNAEFHAVLGYSSYKQGDAATGVSELQRAMQLDPTNQSYVLQLSEVFIAYNNPEASIALLETASRVFARSAKIWFALGVSYIAAEHLEDGEAAMLRSHELDPQLDLVYVVLCLAYRNSGHWDSLLSASDKLILVNPDNYLGYFYKAYALSRETSSDSSEIQKLLERSCALDSDDPEPHYELAKILLAQRSERDRALQELEKIVASKAHFAPAYYQLYRLYAERGDKAKSEQAWRTYEQLRQERGQPVPKLLVQIRER